MKMEYQKIMNLLENAPNQPSKLWVEINDNTRGTYNTNNQIKLKNSMPKSNLCDYNGAYVLVKGTISIASVPPPPANPDNNNKLCSIY